MTTLSRYLLPLCLLVNACEPHSGPEQGPPLLPAKRHEREADHPVQEAKQNPLGEEHFVRSNSNRDPFQEFDTSPIVCRLGDAVPAEDFSLQELKLRGIVRGSARPTAMLVDPKGRGWILKEGDFFGKPEVVRRGEAPGAEYLVFWRVDRIRDGNVVLVQDGSGQSSRPVTRVISL